MKTELKARGETYFPSGLVISHHTPFAERYRGFHHQNFSNTFPNGGKVLDER